MKLEYTLYRIVHLLVLIEFVIRYTMQKMNNMEVKLQPSVTIHLILKSEYEILIIISSIRFLVASQ